MTSSHNVRDWAIALFFSVSILTIYQWASQRHFNSTAITAAQFVELLKQNNNVIVVDLRESNEIQRFPLSIPYVHLSYLWLRKWHTLPAITPGVLYVFVCSDGNRARMISSLLYENGYPTYYLRDGIWSLKSQMGKPVSVAEF